MDTHIDYLEMFVHSNLPLKRYLYYVVWIT